MPSLRDIKRRIGSVEKTQQITRAMRMVSAAKLRRAQAAITAARPYAERMVATLSEVAAARSDAEHPLLERHERQGRLELVVIASDRGLCGAYNANLLRAAEGHLRERGSDFDAVSVTPVGARAHDYFRRRHRSRITRAYDYLGRIEYGHAVEIASRLTQRYASGELDEVALVYSEFLSALTQKPVVQQLLPVAPSAGAASPTAGAAPYEIEPGAQQLLNVLAPKVIEVAVFRALLENQAGEHAARMAAMESATRNTEELIDSLTLQYNRARQAAITKELVEIITGAEAI